MVWRIIDSGVLTAEENMRVDAAFLDALAPDGTPLLRLYDWQGPSATYGYFIEPKKYFQQTPLHNGQLSIARRPTGGGILFHTCDVTFSVFIPSNHSAYTTNTLDNYAFVNNRVAEAIQEFAGGSVDWELLDHDPTPDTPESVHFCMAKPTQFDVVIKGKKVGGGAQRRTKKGILHQGSVALTLPSEELLNRFLLPQIDVCSAMQRNGGALLGIGADRGYKEARVEFNKCLANKFKLII